MLRAGLPGSHYNRGNFRWPVITLRYLLLTLSYLTVAIVAMFIGVRISEPAAAPAANVPALPAPSIASAQSANSLEPGGTQVEPQGMRQDARLSFDDIDRQTTIFDRQYIAHQLAAVSNVPELIGLTNQVIHNDDPFFSYNLATIFLERLLAIDVQAALDYVDNASLTRKQQQQFLAHIYTSWVRHDPERAIDAFRDLTDVSLKNTIGLQMLRDSTLATSGLLAEIRDEMGAFGMQASESIRLQQLSPSQIFEEAMLLTGRDRQQRLMGALARWYQEDPATALIKLLDIPNVQERNNALRMIVSMATRTNPSEALALVQNYAPNDQSLERQVLMSWAQIDREQAMPILEAYVTRTGEGQILASVVSNWARSDPRAAIAFAEGISSEHRSRVLQAVAFAYVSADPHNAMPWLMSLDDPQVRRQAIGALPQADVNLAETWLRRIDDENMQQSLLQGIAQVMAGADPESAMVWLSNRQGQAGYDSAVSTVMNQWARINPEQSARYLERFDRNSDFQGVFGSTAGAWANRDLGGAVAWFNTLPDGANRDSVGRTLALHSARTDIDVTLDILGELDDTLASELRLQVAYGWAAREPDAIENIIGALALDSRQATQLRDRPQ